MANKPSKGDKSTKAPRAAMETSTAGEKSRKPMSGKPAAKTMMGDKSKKPKKGSKSSKHNVG